MSSQTLKAFIREALVVEIGMSYGQDMRYNPRPPGTAAPATPAPEKVEVYLGFMGAFSAGGKPDYVVVADAVTDKLLIVAHSKSEYAPESEDDIFGQAKQLKKFMSIGAYPAPIPFLSRLALGAITVDDSEGLPDSNAYEISKGLIGTWHMLEDDKTTLNNVLPNFQTLKLPGGDVDLTDPTVLGDLPGGGWRSNTGYYLVPRDKNLFKGEHEAQKEYTEKFKRDAYKFKCALDANEVLSYLTNSDIKSGEYALAAACMYTYAGSLSGQILSAIVVGLVASAVATPMVGLLTGLAAMSFHDMAFRIVVIRWAYANGYKDFFHANLVYFIITLLFAGFNAFKALKALPAAAAGAQTVAKTGWLGQTLGATFKPAGWKEPVWSQIVSFLAEFILSVGAYVFADAAGQIDREKVIALINDPAAVEREMQDSLGKLYQAAGAQFPSR